ncbi:hypothetical protein [Parasitella parasitica]|uniref:F-box domain-containing protein n=1 Tax=Parasitella parasitica TaxID=35722 RepID=A0A0B7N7N6_9FUNG|nr:hypothetical protein [Parasitella parasitica]
MESLPYENLVHIFSHLTFSEKRNLASTCKKWHALIMNSYLLYTDFQIHNELNYSLFKNYFLQKSNNNQDVRNLYLSFTYIETAELLALLEHFPKLQELDWEDHVDIDLDLVNEENAKYWRKITRFTETGHVPLSTKILQYNGFCNLIELDVNFHGSDDCDLLVQQLSKAPKLAVLTFRNGEMFLSDLAQLQQNTPNLESLELYEMELMEASDDNDDVDETATTSSGSSMTERRINATNVATSNKLKQVEINDYTIDRYRGFLAYVALNYKNLETLTIHRDKNSEEAFLSRTNPAHLIAIASNCPRLVSYDVDIHPITAAVLKEMDLNGIRMKRMRISPYRNSLLTQQIKDILESDQKNFIETMVIDCSCPSFFPSKHTDSKKDDISKRRSELFASLQKFPKLKHVEMIGKYNCQGHLLADFPFDELLKPLNEHLKIIKLVNWNMSLAAVNDRRFEAKKLRDLILVDVNINNANEKVMPFVSKTCQNLSKLTIKRTIQHDKTYMIECPGHRFTCITLNWKAIEGRQYYYNVNKNVWYTVDDGVLQTTCSEPPESVEHPTVSLDYSSCTSLRIGNAYVYNNF